MKAALIGYGKMGREVAAALAERGHEVAAVFDAGDIFGAGDLAGSDVAIEFSTPDAAFDNVRRCLEAGIPVVCGTTGWQERLPEARELCERLDGTFFYATNFSVGVNIFFAVNERLAQIMNGFPEYGVSVRETHHIHKKDSPSGTAVTLAEGIMSNMERKVSWVNHPTDEPQVVGIESVREGEVFGIHEVRYESAADSIEMIHSTRSRRGLALGAVMAAEYSTEHKGILSMKDLLKL